jgi:hypothetical protein
MPSLSRAAAAAVVRPLVPSASLPTLLADRALFGRRHVGVAVLFEDVATGQ